MRKWLVVAYAVPLLPLLLLFWNDVTPESPPELARADELSSRGDYEGAIRVLLAALETPALQRNGAAAAEARYQLAAAHNNLGDYATALRFAQEAEALFRRNGQLPESAVAAAGIGTLQNTLGQYEEGAQSLLKALAMFRRVGDE